MNLELTDEQTALRDTLRRYLAEKASLATYVRPMLGDEVAGADAVWRGLAAMGVTGLLVPEERDGAGMTMVEAGVVAEELGAALYPGPWISTAVASTRALVRTGADGNAAVLLAGIADGSTVTTVGPLVGPRPAAKDGPRLHGSVTGLPGANDADVILVFADEPDGIGLYSVDTSSESVTMASCVHVDPTRVLADVTFDGTCARRLASVPADVLRAVIDDVVIAYAADALGAATTVMNLAIEYAKVRKQFDQPIGSFQAVQHLCVDMYEATELARSGVIHALWAADAADPAEHHLAALRAKAFAGRLTAVGDTAIQVFGGIGFTWEHDAHLYLKRLLGWSGFLGAPDRYLEEVGKELV
ncbi:acyl-CoA dehydrogenase family protein [Mycolicibacterium gadium]|uniref:Acyl-CoA/acyl-ACP dehydrogenase n=1 Tax=Mycolicibacterium gadium TaxID=1794 RepID=A0ABT6GQC0_MYCGU|nr:acyl-CoA dehydrogenase family protein [Mycolicibacterium gadium]MDG5483407.1 acyl-CoA/acyl-ACP dehydrogenase [Mycolicibacterium gadium]